jgi:glycosyltransferase involved in cell wall biosynthesis
MHILYIACGSGSDPTLGGSLARTIEIAKRMNDNNVYFLTTTGGKQQINIKLCQRQHGLVFEIKTPLGDYEMDRWYYLRQLWSYILVFFKSMFFDYPVIDIIYLDSDGLWDIFPALWYKMKHPKVKIISMNHHLVSKGKWLQNICHFLIKRLADCIFVLDTPEGYKIEDKLYKPGFFYRVQNGIDYDFIKNTPQLEKKYDACFFGTIRPSKGLSDILSIWTRVNAKRNTNLLIIGYTHPQYLPYLQHPNIKIVGYIKDKEEAYKLIKQCKIFISPSREEGWGITNMECLACNLPGVVWDLPVYEHILNFGIRKVPVGDYKQFANKVIELLNNPCQPMASVEQFDWNIIAKKEIKIYEDLLRN